MDTVPVWTIPAHKQGDTWDSRPISINQDMTGCLIEAEFRLPNGLVTKRFSTADGTISVQSAGPSSVFVLQSFLCQMPVGDHVGELYITYPGGRRKTRLDIRWSIIE